MDPDAYLERLQAQLQGFSPAEQAQLIEEIAAHIEEAENDPGLGPDRPDRTARLEGELGSPDDLGRRLKQVHRPRRWLDYFLVALPALLVFPLAPLLAGWLTGLAAPGAPQTAQADALTWASLRLSIVIQAGLVLLSRWKASPGALIYWLDSTLLGIAGVLLSGIRWPWLPADFSSTRSIGALQAFIWLAAAALLLAWLLRVVSAQRSEPLLVVLALIPFLFATANYLAGLTLLYHPGVSLEYFLPVIGWFGLHQVAGVIWPAMFFLPNQRDLRWAGLLLLPVTQAIYFVWPYRAYPLVASLYLLPVALVLAGWARDARARLLQNTL